MLKLYKPSLDELWFKEKMLSSEETMSYNHVWGGTIPFPKDEWIDWYDYWIINANNERFYRYLQDEMDNFVGEIAYHFDNEYQGYVADIIIFSPYRGKGYGKEGLKMLCAVAKENGIKELYDDIASDNSAIKMFLKEGFYEIARTDDKIILKKDL